MNIPTFLFTFLALGTVTNELFVSGKCFSSLDEIREGINNSTSAITVCQGEYMWTDDKAITISEYVSIDCENDEAGSCKFNGGCLRKGKTCSPLGDRTNFTTPMFLVMVDNANVYFKHITFMNGGNEVGDGGAISVSSGAFNCYNCEFTRNFAKGGGGAVHAVAADEDKFTAVTFRTTSFTENRANEGGAINAASLSSFMELDYCYFYNNRADTDGGAVKILNTEFYASSAQFHGNSAFGHGGGVYMENIADNGISFYGTRFIKNTVGKKRGKWRESNGTAIYAKCDLCEGDTDFSISNTCFYQNDATGDNTGVGTIYMQGSYDDYDYHLTGSNNRKDNVCDDDEAIVLVSGNDQSTICRRFNGDRRSTCPGSIYND